MVAEFVCCVVLLCVCVVQASGSVSSGEAARALTKRLEEAEVGTNADASV